jgi:hypothetical protein
MMGSMRPSWHRLRLGAVLLGSAILLLLLVHRDWVQVVALGLGLLGALCVLSAVGPPRDGGRRAGPFQD